FALFPGHSDAEAFVGVDEVVVIIFAEIDLHPVDLAGEPAAVHGVVGGNGGAGFVADIRCLVGGEDHRLGGSDAAGPDSCAVVVQGNVAALGQPAAVVGELHPHLVCAVRDRLVGLGGELLDAKHVVDELGLAVLRIEAPATEATALGDDHPFDSGGRDLDVGGDGERLVLDTDHTVL